MKRKRIDRILGRLYDLAFNHTHDLDLGVSRSESEIALSQEWDGRLTWNEKDVSHPFMAMILTSVTMVVWADVSNSDRVTSDVGVLSTYLVIYLYNHNKKNLMPILYMYAMTMWWKTNIFCNITVPLWRESINVWWIPLESWHFVSESTSEQWISRKKDQLVLFEREATQSLGGFPHKRSAMLHFVVFFVVSIKYIAVFRPLRVFTGLASYFV